ncbi:TCR/Tet family MFS transporter [Trinickia violacea]|uniref:TCR/Tet family MFS transporter n=1 Tax=Trinickia violacea TaxID=2571746 RepID=A0A4P8IKA5_9BURK|nr:TCR/Tet family MFS transporter [Trinickia violacea]
MSRPLVVIFATVALDAAGIALIFPILPSLLRSMSGTDEVSSLFGALLALYALMQFVFAPVLGVLSDRYGRRPVLLMSLAGAAVDYLIMAFTPHLWMLFAGRACCDRGITRPGGVPREASPEKKKAAEPFGSAAFCIWWRIRDSRLVNWEPCPVWLCGCYTTSA